VSRTDEPDGLVSAVETMFARALFEVMGASHWCLQSIEDCVAVCLLGTWQAGTCCLIGRAAALQPCMLHYSQSRLVCSLSWCRVHPWACSVAAGDGSTMQRGNPPNLHLSQVHMPTHESQTLLSQHNAADIHTQSPSKQPQPKP
jgi:hypothetical protein